MYDRILLQQRNLELLAIILINLSGNERGFGQAWGKFRMVLKCRSVGSTHFDHKNIEELAWKLAQSFEKYGDKNKILIVSKQATHDHVLRKLRKHPSVKEVGLDSIWQNLPQRISSNATTEGPLSVPAIDQVTQYTTEELEAVVKIREFWRKRLPSLLQRRKYLSTREGQFFRRHSSICASHRSTPKVYIALLSSGVQVSLKVDGVQDSLQDRHESIMRHIVRADPSEDTYEALDGCLQRVGNLKSELKSQASRMSASCLSEVLEKGDLRELRQILDAVEASTAAAESGLAQIMTDMRNMYVEDGITHLGELM
uniref:Uncharacterized protein n=1 Tax=Cladonia uncialis subsp. uncialis TaxID=180999 RepID=A0A1Z1C4G9_CLAUC|nr:hypothetical protein [Cladonia uncialis subsp. uncialis]AUW31320.1 hypothetical protein [Cladonia uncialis subsp. uncialis]